MYIYTRQFLNNFNHYKRVNINTLHLDVIVLLQIIVFHNLKWQCWNAECVYLQAEGAQQRRHRGDDEADDVGAAPSGSQEGAEPATVADVAEGGAEGATGRGHGAQVPQQSHPRRQEARHRPSGPRVRTVAQRCNTHTDSVPL